MRKRVLWGHHVSDYQEMFDLSDIFSQGALLEYGCGASAVNAELHEKGRSMVSFDPLFSQDKTALKKEVLRCFDERVEQVLAYQAQFNVEKYGSMEAFLSDRRAGMALFFEDYEQGVREKRYQPLPEGGLPFDDVTFDLALSSHYFFSGAGAQSVDWHVNTFRELARVAREVRVFPLIQREGEPSELLGPVLLGLQQANFGSEVREVRCALYPEGNAMLRVWAQTCEV
jgi:hypothetical protein